MSIYINGTPGYLPGAGAQKNTPDSPSVSFKDVLRSAAVPREEISSGMTAGEKYRASCRDYTHSGELDALTLTDYSGLSDEERYRVIYEKYQHCFGENFLDSEAVPFPGTAEDDVIKNFYSEVTSNCADPKEARRLALYGTGDEYETRRAIIDKYVKDGGITYGDLYKMANEMSECGVGKGLLGWTEESVCDMIAAGQGVADIWEYIDYMDNCTKDVNDISAIKYGMLDRRIGSGLVGRLEYYAGHGKGRFADVLEQVMSAVSVTPGAGGTDEKLPVN